MFNLIMSVEVMELTTLIYKGNNLYEVPAVYHIDKGGAFFVSISRKDYKRLLLLLPFQYKNQLRIFK